jgi:hypothetical protein
MIIENRSKELAVGFVKSAGLLSDIKGVVANSLGGAASGAAIGGSIGMGIGGIKDAIKGYRSAEGSLAQRLKAGLSSGAKGSLRTGLTGAEIGAGIGGLSNLVDAINAERIFAKSPGGKSSNIAALELSRSLLDEPSMGAIMGGPEAVAKARKQYTDSIGRLRGDVIPSFIAGLNTPLNHIRYGTLPLQTKNPLFPNGLW